MTKFFRYWPSWLFSVLVFGAILWLTLAPDPLPDNDLPVFPGIDKVVHACMFGGMTFALLFDIVLCRIRHEHSQPARFSALTLFIIGLAVGAFGGFIEVIQMAMDMGRSADIVDFLADIAGVLIFLLLSPYLLRCIFHLGN